MGRPTGPKPGFTREDLIDACFERTASAARPGDSVGDSPITGLDLVRLRGNEATRANDVPEALVPTDADFQRGWLDRKIDIVGVEARL